jgi:uncharacterized protein YbjT (DUF2867 family)
VNVKIVIIGGSGLIGSKVVRKLREQGHDAVPASRSIRETDFWVNAGGDEAFSTPDSIL